MRIYPIDVIEHRERQICTQLGISYDRADRVMIRRTAIASLDAEGPPRRYVADEIFTTTREAVTVEWVGVGWSPAQVCKGAA